MNSSPYSPRATQYWPLLILLACCWLPSGGFAQRSEWYTLLRPFVSTTLYTDIKLTTPVQDGAGHIYQGYNFADSMRVTRGPLPDTTIRGHAPGQYACCVISQVPSGHRNWVWSARGGTGSRRVAAVVKATPTTLLALLDVTGTFIAGPDTLTVPASANSAMVLVNLAMDGHVRWARLVARANSTLHPLRAADDLAVDPTGHIIIAGTYAGTGAVGNQALPTVSTSQPHAFVARLDSLGSTQWVRTVTGFNDSKGLYACVDSTGSVYFAGTYLGQVFVGAVSLQVPGSADDQVFVAKYTPTGQVQWARGAGSRTFTCSSSRPVVHPSGDLLLHISADAAFGTSISSSRHLLRVQPNGTLRWMRFMVGWDLSCDRFGNIYATGGYGYNGATTPTLSNGVVLPPAPTPMGNTPARSALIMYDAELVPQWAITIPTFRNGGGTLEKSPTVTPDGRVFANGYVSSTVVLAGDTIRRGAGQGGTWRYLWKVRAPLAFGEAGKRLVCGGGTYPVPFTRDSAAFTTARPVVAELSDATGSFATPIVIGTATGAAERDTIQLIIPAATAPGRGYRVRLKTVTPYLLAAGDGLALEITAAGVARILASDTVAVCPGQPFPLLRAEASFGSTLQWVRNSQPLAGATTATLLPTQPGTYTLQATSSNCGPAVSRPVEVLAAPTPVVTLTPFGTTVSVTATSYALSGGSPAGGQWNGPGVSGSTFNPSAVGLGLHSITYTYTNRYGCTASATQSIQVVQPVGLDNANLVQAFALSPNPAHTTVALSGAFGPTATLFDALGRALRTVQLSDGAATLDVRGLPAGVYVVRAGGTAHRLLIE